MRTRTGTGVVIALFLAFSLLCSVGLVAQDKLLIPSTATTTQKSEANAAAVDCATFAADGVTCIAGQYYNSDNAKPSTTWTPIATVTNYGAWGVGNGSANGCISCHHSSVNGLESNGMSSGGAYLIGGHKNILRKVTPGTVILNSEGVQVSTVADHNGALYNMDVNGILTAGTDTATHAGAGAQAWFLAGWTPEPDVFGNFGQTVSGIPYGSCGRCHTTGYRFDNNGPEPTLYDATTKLTTAQFPRSPAGSKSGDTTTASSWFLSGIQCERCHKADMQYDATSVTTTYNTGTKTAPVWTSTGGRVNHFTNVNVDVANVDLANCVWNTARSRYDCPTKPVVAVGDFNVPTVQPLVSVNGTLPTIADKFTGRPVPKAPYALLCAECHQAYATWASKTAGVVGEIHVTPLPGFEDLVPTMDTNKFSTTKPATGQFSATFACNGVTPAITTTTNPTNYYDACIAAGGTVAYVPGGMSHGMATTFFNSPHARVKGYIDTKNPASADSSLYVKGGTLTTGLLAGKTVDGSFNTHFYSEAGVQGSCMGCHDIHGYLEGYVETEATNVKKTMTGCAECHMDGSRYSIAMPSHSSGVGTPFPYGTDKTADDSYSCKTCHMMGTQAGGHYHFLRINPDVAYNTFPDAATYYKGVGSGKFGKLNTYAETFYGANGPDTYPAVALDVDMACGQCHTGGDGTKNPYGIVPTGAPVFTRAQLAVYAKGIHNTGTTAAATPTFSVGGGTYTSPLSVTISEAVPTAIICYTTDGVSTPAVGDSTPGAETITPVCTTGTKYTDPINITANTVLKAIAGGASAAGPMLTPSTVASATYNFQATTPVLKGGSFTVQQTVDLSLAGATGYCTAPAGQNCTTMVAIPASPLTVSVPTTIRAVNAPAGMLSSPIVTATFMITPSTPTFSVVSGKIIKGSPVTITGPAGSTIYYTTNGSTPTKASLSGTANSGTATVTIGASMYLKAIAVYTSGSQTAQSAVATATYMAY